MPHPNPETALEMLEYCRFAYKAYAQTCEYPMDPFFESHGAGVWQGARDRVMAHVHGMLKSDVEVQKFDPILYDLTKAPDPSDHVVYRGGTGEEPYILFHARPLDRSIGYAMGEDLEGNEIWGREIPLAEGNKRCCYFQGKTGMTKSHPRAGWPTWLGAAIYDPIAQSMVVAFRGSRSGSGGRALAQAQTQSAGSPDWVTDMNHLKGVEVEEFDGATLCAGFWHAYESCRKSLNAAFFDALHHRPLKTVYFTGHSLGGALAQCAYIDMMGGSLFARSQAMEKLKASLDVHCYAISAPPILLGAKSLEKVADAVGGELNVYHYFAPKDAVHDSPEVAFSGATAMNWVVGVSTHPLTKPVHMGEEFPLKDAKAGFPTAHEPLEVRKGLLGEIARSSRMGLLPDPEFWPTFKLGVADAKPPFVSEFTGGDRIVPHLKTALNRSLSAKQAEALAGLWATVIKSKHSGDYAMMGDVEAEGFDDFAEAVKRLTYLGNPFNEDGRSQVMKEVFALRERLIKLGSKASSHKASASVVFVMLQFITARLHDLL